MKAVKHRSLIVPAALMGALLLCAGGVLQAQEAVAPVAEVVAEADVPIEAAPAVEAPVAGAFARGVVELEETALPEGNADPSGRISVSLDAIELADVVRLFTRLSGANIICNTTNLKGSVTANLEDVEWEPAFRAILERQGLLLQEDLRNKGIYYIEPRQADAPEPWVTETFKLSYLKSIEAAELLKSMLGLAEEDEKTKAPAKAKTGAAGKEDVGVVLRKEGRVVSYPAGNMIVVSTTATKMEEIRAVLASVDLPRPQVYIEAKIIELTGDAGKKIGLDWSMLDGYEIGVGNLTRSYTKTRKREKGDADYAVSEAAAVFDHNGKRMSAESAPGSDMGLAAALNPVSIANSATEYAGVDSATPGAAAVSGMNDVSARFTTVSDVRSAIFGADALSLVLSALQTTEDAAIISNPKVIVANEERALIDMAYKEPYVTVERKTDGTGDNTTYTYSTKMEVIPGDSKENKLLPYIEQAFFTYGIKLEVTPRINNPSNITVTIEPTLSNLQSYYSPAGEGSTRYPLIQSKHVKTTFSLGNGQTAVIGGLTTTSEDEFVKKIPLLGDIPLIGKYLFSHTSKKKSQRETIIFVTVGILGAEDQRNALAFPEASTLVQKRVDAEGRLIKAPPEVDPAMSELVPELVAE
jgi:type IV pilus assembly protein PilQ